MANISVLNTNAQLSGKTITTAEGDWTISGAWTFTGNQTFNGNVAIGNGVGDTLTVTSTITSNLIFTDNTYDIGASGATRPRDLFLARNATVGGTLGVTGTTTVAALAATGAVTLATGSAGTVTIGGGATASELRLLEPSGSGANYTAFKAQAQSGDVTYILPNADGSSGQQLTTNGSGTLSWSASGGLLPAVMLSTLFETAGRFSVVNVNGGGSTFGANGVTLATSATISSSTRTSWLAIMTGAASSIVAAPVAFGISGGIDALGTDCQVYAGLVLPTVGGAGITFTDAHIGFKIVRAASGACSLYGTVATGGTETATAALTTFALDDDFDLALRVTSTSLVEFWWRKGGSAWSSATSVTTNIPSSSTISAVAAVAASNVGVATATTFRFTGAYVLR